MEILFMTHLGVIGFIGWLWKDIWDDDFSCAANVWTEDKTMKRWKPKMSSTGVFELEAELTAPVPESKEQSGEFRGQQGTLEFESGSVANVKVMRRFGINWPRAY